jgi:uncharacterized membrane protein
LALFVFGLVSASAHDKKPTIIPITVQGAMVAVAFDNNQAGQVVGSYVYEATPTVSHGFLYENGQFTTIDVQGGSGTWPLSINTDGVITGYYLDSDFVAHGFVYKHGHFTLIEDIPYAISGPRSPRTPGGYAQDLAAPTMALNPEPSTQKE